MGILGKRDRRPLLGGNVYALAVHNDELAVGGQFTIAGGRVSAYWARWA